MGLKIEELMQKISLPKKYFNNDFMLHEKFKEEMDFFVLLLSECDGKEFELEKQEKVKNSISEIYEISIKNADSILNVLNHYENADLQNAQNEFDSLMKSLEKELFFGCIDGRLRITAENESYITNLRTTSGSQYFRIRPSNYESNDISQNADELFHIPISMRAYSNNERFSLAGFPSLYLSTMLPLAWQECGYPPKYYFSEFQYIFETEPELSLLFINSPNEILSWGGTVKYNNFNLWLKVVTRYLKSYPLILASSFVNQSGKVPYKQEYIIPQMLMQWVQRNYSKVQGISYFTCVDTSMWSREWCAYNIAIPAIGPYDNKKYSEFLRKKFCWTLPKYFIIPIGNKEQNENDRKEIYKFISDARNIIRTVQLSSYFIKIIDKMLNIGGCFLSLIDNEEHRNMQLVLQTLNLLDISCSHIKELKLDKLSNEDLKKEQDFIHMNIEEEINIFRNLYIRFIGNDFLDESIKGLIDKYILNSWNHIHPRTQMILLYSDENEIIEVKRWLCENNFLYTQKKLIDDETKYDTLKEISTSSKIQIQDFFEVPVGDDEWVKMNINLIKTPIIVKQNNVSIFSPDETEYYEFVVQGFDESLLRNKLNKIDVTNK